MSDEQIRVLKRYYPAVRNLRKDLAHNIIPMQLYKGMMGTLKRTYEMLHTSISEALDDPYLASLRLDVPENADDKMVAAQISLLVGQLVAYIEGTMEYLKQDVPEEEGRGSEVRRPERRSIERFDRFLDDTE